MQPLPETTTALAALARVSDVDEAALVDSFNRTASSTQTIAPECVGLTVSFLREGVSFTWVATDLEAATLDAVQYLDGGPCVASLEAAQVVTDADDGPLDERRWRTYAAATARAGVSSTLSIPLMTGAEVYGGVNLYGGTPDAFDGLHEQLAAQYGGWAAGAVTNADLSFSTMARARSAPQVIEDDARCHQAVGMIMAAHEVDQPTARRRLDDAAARAGVSVAEVAQVLTATRLL